MINNKQVMKKILKCIVLTITISVLTSCGADHYTMKGDTFTVVEESRYRNSADSLSKYILEYKDNRLEGTGEPISELEVILHRDVFEVGDKFKLVKIEK